MPGTIVPPGFSQVIVPMQHAAAARAAIITFGIENAQDPPDTSSANFCLAMIEDTWAPTVDAQVTIGPVIIRVGSDPGPGPVVEGTTTITGLNGAEQCPSNCALLVRKRTGSGGRANRGRFYIPWALQENMVSDTGVIDAGYVDTVQDQMTDFLAQLAASSTVGPMVILHTEVGLPTPVTNLTVDGLIATQRRRLGR